MKSSLVKDLGAVFTPQPIVNILLDILPVDLWKNNKLVWLEPCVGTGNIVMEIQRRNPKLDITCYEINKEFCKIFQENTGIKPINEDFISHSFERKFDVIIGNPPYQKPNKKNKKARGGKSQLYLEFLEKCLNLLNPDGYLIFVHPCNWRKINNTILQKILKNMTIHNLTLCQKNIFPNIHVNVDWYMIQNTISEDIMTHVINNDGNVVKMKLDKNLPFIPNTINEEIQTFILDKMNCKQYYKCILSCELHAYTKRTLISKKQTKIHKYPLYNTSAQPYQWSEIPHTFQNHKKVIMSNSGKLNPFYDDGKLGTTQNSMFILVQNENEAKKIIDKILKYNYFISICQWGLFRTEKNLIEFLLRK